MTQEQVERALVVVAHPDDVDFGSAGTIASWTDSGIAVTYCICTNGDAGGFDPDARNPYTHLELAAEGLEAWSVSETWVMTAGAGADTWVDITDQFDRKVAALRRHVSQTSHMDDLEGLLRGFLARNAHLAGLPEGRLAEGFRVVDTR